MLRALRIGHAHCATVRTGVTLLVPDAPVVMAVDVRGGGPGTRETDALSPDTLVERVHGLVLAGGSVFGLAAADELALLLSRAGIGLDVGVCRVPVVPAAILFDLGNGGDKGWDEPPYRRLAREAFAALTDTPVWGRVGAGFGATAGSRAGGIGFADTLLDNGGRVMAAVAVNSFGEVSASPALDGPVPMPKLARARGLARQNTCIGFVATDVPLTRGAARRVAVMAQDGLARVIRPIHTPFDGDTLFALSTAPGTPGMVDPVLLTELGTRAADCVANAVFNAIG
ncbi:P1 family peptidase [Sandaracinobacteroides saxicola]|uniref:P1 family peptidase n=1 Tax=Sandaracinobacteroides saxicola TaxID=2759707 RepID=A0A7G5IM07_9SPHN|nr:P1 family peptidase [Sandaracinobacteroides saxicola]QMW24399.1 P1 family peptidase [Sandaracinobacteroides saxicola]